jgi:hypothetical protein
LVAVVALSATTTSLSKVAASGSDAFAACAWPEFIVAMTRIMAAASGRRLGIFLIIMS